MSLLLQLIRNYWVLLSFILASLITFLSLTPMEQLPSVPGSDKTHHFIAYSALVFPLMLKKPNYWIVVVLLFTLLSGAIELIQPYQNRYGEWMDLFANIGGLICGSVFAYFVNRVCPAE
ncbi:VanZ family protein [Psychromonas sp. GE-S-Ul-11]|uniref:VanZ family protein n=1 Tax=unclassified Psychromonas TaxID=2614957 RepID=UPI00390C8213